MPDCPDDTDLAGFLNDSLTSERLTHVSGHVDECASCQARLDQLTEQANSAVARFKELSVVLPDAASGVASSPEAATQILGGKPIVPSFIGLPRVPGFEVAAEIGRGGMGVVYRARHRRLNRLVALKMILAGSAADPHVVQRFLFEGEVLARVQHPQVVQVFEVDTYEGPNRLPIPYLAMELLEGGTLSRRLRDANDGIVPRFTPRGAAELLEGISRAVHAAHLQGVIHRDLKPGNILFSVESRSTSVEGHKVESRKVETQKTKAPGVTTSDATTFEAKPKVTDFGLAKFTQDSGADLTQTGQIVGTPHYMAPEQATGAKQVGPAVDVYALGAILFECLAGRPPFTGTEPMSVMLKVVNEAPPDVRSLCPDISRDLAAVTMKCLEKEPSRRYASAEALADDLRRFLDNRPTKARPVTNFERLWFSAKRNPNVAGLLATLAGVLLSAFVAFAVMWVRAEEKAASEMRLKQSAEGANARANEAIVEMQRREAQLVFRRAVVWCEEGRVEEGLELFIRAAELAAELNDENLERVARVNVAAWSRDLPQPTQPFKHTEQPRLAAFHPDGKHMLTGGRARELYLWDIAMRKRVRTYKPSSRFNPLLLNVQPKLMTYWTVAISPDGNTIAAGGTDGGITLWETWAEGTKSEVEPLAAFPLGDEAVRKLVDGTPSVWTMGFTSNQILWTGDGANGLRRWDLTNPRQPSSKRFIPKSGAADSTLHIMVVSNDRKRLYTGDRAGRVREWDVETGRDLREWRTKGWITDVALSADETRLAATGPEGYVHVFEIKSGREVLKLSLAGAYGNGVAFAPKRPLLVASDGDGNVRFWHSDTGQPISIPLRFQGEVTRMRFRPNSDQFAVPAGDTVHLCDLPDPPGDLVSVGRGARIRGLDFSPTGDRLAVSDDATFDLFNPLTQTRVPLATPLKGDALTIRFDSDPNRPRIFRGTRDGLDWFTTPDGHRQSTSVAVAAAGWAVLRIPDGTPQPIRVFNRIRASRIESLKGGHLFVLSSVLVARFDPATLEQSAINRPKEVMPAGVEFSALAVRPDGGEVLVGFGDSVLLLKGDTLELVREWPIGDEVLDARYTPDGKRVLLGRRANVAELLDAATGQRVGAPMPHARAVASVGISPNGAVLLTGSRDGTARFWDAATGLPLGSPLRHVGPVTHVAFAPDGDHVATGTGDGHVMLWDIPPPPAKGTVEELRAKFGKKP